MNIVLTKIISAGEKSPKHISVANLDNVITNTLLEFDLRPEWVKKIPLRNSKDSIKFRYKVRLPKDLPVTVILNDINMRFIKEKFRIASRETKTNKQSLLRIFYGKALLNETEFTTDTSISRNKPVFGFMISDVENMNQDELNDLLSYPEKFAVLLTPSQKSETLKKAITDSGREFAVLVKDGNDEVRFRFSEDYTKGRLNGSVTNLVKAFSDAQLFIRDNFKNPDLSSQVDNLFNTRRIKLVHYDLYPQITERDDQTLTDVLNAQIRRSAASKVFVVSSGDFMSLIPELRKLRKRGYRFVMPSVINYGN